jgi:hypothetical protein
VYRASITYPCLHHWIFFPPSLWSTNGPRTAAVGSVYSPTSGFPRSALSQQCGPLSQAGHSRTRLSSHTVPFINRAMPIARFSSPFAPLSLSLEEKEQLGHVADTILDETTAMYERFLKQDKGHVDPKTWEHIREREKMRVYLNRRPGGGTGTTTCTCSSRSELFSAHSTMQCTVQ